MVQIMTQPQDGVLPLSGMNAGSSIQAVPGDHSLFSSLLQEIVPPAPTIAGVVTQGAASKVGTEQGAAPGKGSLHHNSKTVPDEEQADPVDDHMARLLATACLIGGLQSRPDPGTKPVATGERDGIPATQGEAAGVNASGATPSLLTVDGQAREGTPGGTALPSLAGLALAQVVTGEGAVTGATGTQVPSGDAGVAGGARQSAHDAVSTGTEESGTLISLLPQSRKALRQSVPSAGPPGEAEKSVSDAAVSGKPTIASPGSEAFSAAVQTWAKSAPPQLPASEKQAEAVRPGKGPGPTGALDANRVQTTDRALLAGNMLPPPDGRETAPPQGAGTPVGSPAGAAMEVVFADASPKGGSHERDENGDAGEREKGKNSFPNSAVAAPRTLDLTESGRPAFQPKVDDAKNALHESILAQVKEGVVSHDGKGNGQMTVRLNPEELGEIQINVRVEAQRVKVEVVTDNRTVREALMGNLDTLKETLLKQNLNMEGFAVSTGGGNGFSQPFREERGDQRNASRIPFGGESGPLDPPTGKSGVVWGDAESSLVDLRL